MPTASIGDLTDAQLKNTMIKKFQRSAADLDLQKPSEVRTPAALLRTVVYIEDHFQQFEKCEQTGEGYHEKTDEGYHAVSELPAYLFVWDR